jgi:hypothetical protein
MLFIKDYYLAHVLSGHVQLKFSCKMSSLALSRRTVEGPSHISVKIWDTRSKMRKVGTIFFLLTRALDIITIGCFDHRTYFQSS